MSSVRPPSLPLVAVGGTAAHVWSVESGQLPAGLSLDSASGLISGTPTAEGAVTVDVAAGAAPRRGRRPAPPERLIAGVPERTLLVAGTCVFASLAVIGLAISALV